MWGGINLPSPNWRVCNGDILYIHQYKELFKFIAHNFGNVNASSTYDPSKQFFLPDFRGRFIRGVDNTPNGRDPDRTTRTDMQSGVKRGQEVGSLQNDDFKTHTHSNYYEPSGVGTAKIGLASGLGAHHKIINTGNTGGKETRPINAYLYFIIKVFN